MGPVLVTNSHFHMQEVSNRARLIEKIQGGSYEPADHCDRDIFKHFSLLPFFKRRLSFFGGGTLKYCVVHISSVHGHDFVLFSNDICEISVRISMYVITYVIFQSFIFVFAAITSWCSVKESLWRTIEFKNSIED